MKKIFYFLLAVFIIVGCSDQFGINGPNDDDNNNNNNNGTNENANAIEYTYSGTVNYNGPIAADPIFISRETVGSSTVEHYKLTWNACPFNPNNIASLFGVNYIRLSIPHVNKSGQTVYRNEAFDANYYFENVDQNWIYFKVVSLPNQTLKMNVAIKTVNTTAWNKDTCKWWNKMLPDDGQNNIYTLLIQ